MMVFCVGLSGTIASGKSTVAAFFAQWGVSLIHADAIAHNLTAANTEACQQIIDHFGEAFRKKDGSLDRRQLRQVVFTNPTERIWLENLLHPLILQVIEQELAQSQAAYCMVEIPLLIDKQTYPFIDRILVVTSSEELQLKRVMQRDKCSLIEAKSIISTQANKALYLHYADDLLENNGSLDDLRIKAQALHNYYLSLR